MSRSRLTIALDWLALALAVAAVAILLTGGLTLRLGGARITARSADRAALVALAVVALRVALDRRTRPLANAPQVGRAIRDRVYDPALDRVAPLPAAFRWRRLGLATAGICAFAAAMLWPQILNLYHVPDLGDPLFSIWRFSWVFHKLQGDPRALFSPNIFYPNELTLTYSDSMLLPAVTTMPLLAFGLHPVVAYNVMMVATFIASALAMYVLAERLTGSAAAAFVAALLFGFHPYRFEHYSHFELQMTYCMPFALLALHQFAATARMRYAVLAAVLSAGQLYCSMYYAVFFSIFASLVFIVTCWLTRAPLRRLVGPAVVGAVVALMLAWPLARVYRAAHLGDRDKETVAFYSATVGDYVSAHHRSAMWGERIRSRQPERALFPGAVVLLLAAVALVPPIGATRAAYALALVVLFEISRGFNSPFYPYLYEWFEFIRGLRVPARASIIHGIALTLLAGFGVRRLLAGRSVLRDAAGAGGDRGRDCDRREADPAPRTGLAGTAADLRRPGGEQSGPCRVPVRRPPRQLQLAHTVHVLLGVALGRHGQRIQRPFAGRDRRLRAGAAGVSGGTNAVAPARAGDDARVGQLRLVPRRLR